MSLTEKDFPRYVFRAVDGVVHAEIANSPEDYEAALEAGWSHDREGALGDPGDDAKPTREELEQKATELGIQFDGRMKDSTIARKIQEALAAGQV